MTPIPHPASRPTNRRRRYLFLLPLAWCALIFWVSGRPIPEVPGPEIPCLDKILHVGVYAVLSLLWFLALRLNRPQLTFRTAALIAFLLTTAYGATDEFHQSNVPARTADIVDWFADTAGAAIVWMVPARWRKSITGTTPPLS